MRTLIIGSLALLVAACSNDSSAPDAGKSRAGVSGSAPDAALSALACTATIQLLDFKLSPSKLDLSRGHNVLCAENTGQAPHDLALRAADKKLLGQTRKLAPGETAQFAVDLETGAYTMFCTQPGHESLGMSGPVTVE